jgi:hypothetical protein
VRIYVNELFKQKKTWILKSRFLKTCMLQLYDNISSFPGLIAR